MLPKLLLRSAAALAISATPALAQTTNRVAGMVHDETGAPIRSAIVRAELDPPAGSLPSALTAVTDERGRFLFVVARSGNWTFAFEAPGFVLSALVVNVRLGTTPPNLDIRLIRNEAPEASGALAGVDSKALTAQLAAASAMFDEGRYDQAITAYRDIRAKVPALTLVNLQLGNAYLMKKSYPEAEAAFQDVLKSSANDPNGLFAMGTLKEAEGHPAEAADWYQKASSADRLWTRPLMKLAALARASGDNAAAGRYLATVIDVAPESTDAVEAARLQNRSDGAKD